MTCHEQVLCGLVGKDQTTQDDFNGQWLQWQWPSNWGSIDIMIKEMVPVVLSCVVWGLQLAKSRVLFQCDNTGVVAAVNKGSSKVVLAMQLLLSEPWGGMEPWNSEDVSSLSGPWAPLPLPRI